MNTTLNSTTVKPENESDNTVGIIVSCLVGGPILLFGLCFILYMVYFYQIKPWYKKIKNRIKTYCIWFMRKINKTINSCYERNLQRNNRVEESDDIII